MITNHRFWLGAGALCLLGCSTLSVNSQVNPTKKVPASGTFEWIPSPGPLTQQDREIRDAIDKQLLEHGYKHIERDEPPDLEVSYQTQFETKTEANDFEFAFLGTHEPIVQHAEPGPAAFPYREGTLIVQVKDSRGTPLWRGVGSRIIEQAPLSEVQIDDAVSKIFREFPQSRPSNPAVESSVAQRTTTPGARNATETG